MLKTHVICTLTVNLELPFKFVKNYQTIILTALAYKILVIQVQYKNECTIS